MAAVYSILARLNASSPGGAPRSVLLCTITGDAAYPSGGYTFAASNVGLTAIDAVVGGWGDITGAASNKMMGVVWDSAAGKLKITQGTAAAGSPLSEATGNDTDITTSTVLPFLVVGQ